MIHEEVHPGFWGICILFSLQIVTLIKIKRYFNNLIKLIMNLFTCSRQVVTVLLLFKAKTTKNYLIQVQRQKIEKNVIILLISFSWERLWWWFHHANLMGNPDFSYPACKILIIFWHQERIYSSSKCPSLCRIRPPLSSDIWNN